MEELFDLSEEYDQMLNEGLKYSGENKDFFLKGRVNDLHDHLPSDFSPRYILDFGCGIGDTTKYLSEKYPDAKVTGTDLAEGAIRYAANKYEEFSNISFVNLNNLIHKDYFDLVYVNGVFHHIEKAKRQEVTISIFDLMKTGGYFAFFENNPWNPGTMIIMNRIPFDRNADKINYLNAKSLLKSSGFNNIITLRFLFYFPRLLSFFRPLEKILARIPFGAQYYVLVQKK